MISDRKICKALYKGYTIRCTSNKRSLYFMLCNKKLMYMNELLGDLMNIDSSIPSIFSDEWNERVICDISVLIN